MKTPMRHGVAVFLVILLCASLFLVYNGSFNSTSRDANDTHIQHQQLRRPTEASIKVAKPHPPALQGYSGIIDHKGCTDFHLFTKPEENNQCEYWS
ncbi:hypothetical protein LDENG_00072370 [Lucifuga dentata]|nr:hypothetical protein LDENG_00072370 [Lucifuga dentata]